MVEIREDLKRLHYDSPALFVLALAAIGQVLRGACGGDSAVANWLDTHDMTEIPPPPNWDYGARQRITPRVVLQAERLLADPAIVNGMTERETFRLADYVLEAGLNEVNRSDVDLACKPWHPAAQLAAAKVFAERMQALKPGVLHALFGPLEPESGG